MKIVICTSKSWNIENAKKFAHSNKDYDVHIFTQRKELTKEKLDQINPEFVFFRTGHI